jgi:hypothetical protein
MKHTVLTTAFLVSLVSTLAFGASSPTHAGSSLSGVISAAKGAAAEAEMRQLRAKVAMAAKAQAAMGAQAAMASGSSVMPALPVACSVNSDWAFDGRPSLLDNDCR